MSPQAVFSAVLVPQFQRWLGIPVGYLDLSRIYDRRTLSDKTRFVNLRLSGCLF